MGLVTRRYLTRFDQVSRVAEGREGGQGGRMSSKDEEAVERIRRALPPDRPSDIDQLFEEGKKWAETHLPRTAYDHLSPDEAARWILDRAQKERARKARLRAFWWIGAAAIVFVAFTLAVGW